MKFDLSIYNIYTYIKTYLYKFETNNIISTIFLLLIIHIDL